MHVVLFSIVILSHDYRSDNIYKQLLLSFWMHYLKIEGSFFMQSTNVATNIVVSDEINIDESRKHLTNLHSGSEGYITIAKKTQLIANGIIKKMNY